MGGIHRKGTGILLGFSFKNSEYSEKKLWTFGLCFSFLISKALCLMKKFGTRTVPTYFEAFCV